MIDEIKINKAIEMLDSANEIKEMLIELVNEYNEKETENLNNVLTFAEAAELVGIDRAYLTNLAKEGKLVEGKDFRRAGRINLIKKSVILKFFSKRIKGED